MGEPQEPLSKDLLTGHFTARLDPDGTLTIVEEYTTYDAFEEPVNTFTEMVMPAQAVRALHNLLESEEALKRTGHRKRDGSKHEH